MTQDLPIKKYPVTTGEVAKMLGIQHPDHDLPLGSIAPQANHPVANLPVAHLDSHTELHPLPATVHLGEHNLDGASPVQSPFTRFAKTVAPYVAIFSIGLFLYYFFFTAVNFSALFNSAPKAATSQETALEQLEKQDLAAYQTWMEGFYYDVNDPKILDPEADNSGNGLTNFQKYLLKLNPKSYDSLGLGMADTEAIAAGVNPVTGAGLTDSQKSVISQYIDLEVASNRLALNRLQHPSAVAGASLNTNSGILPRDGYVSNYTPAPVVNSNVVYNNDIEINTAIAGRLEIPELNINVPLIWSQNSKDLDKDLQLGVVHYPGTAVPGQIGTTYISGHSSNYPWAKGDYNKVFATLGNLPNNASFKITVVQQNGQNAVFHYIVTHRKEYKATDPEQFQNSGKSVVALSTCWPVNSTSKRLVVFAELTQVEK